MWNNQGYNNYYNGGYGYGGYGYGGYGGYDQYGGYYDQSGVYYDATGKPQTEGQRRHDDIYYNKKNMNTGRTDLKKDQTLR
jgi:outer membrane protein insertion porin family